MRPPQRGTWHLCAAQDSPQADLQLEGSQFIAAQVLAQAHGQGAPLSGSTFPWTFSLE